MVLLVPLPWRRGYECPAAAASTLDCSNPLSNDSSANRTLDFGIRGWGSSPSGARFCESVVSRMGYCEAKTRRMCRVHDDGFPLRGEPILRLLATSCVGVASRRLLLDLRRVLALLLEFWTAGPRRVETAMPKRPTAWRRTHSMQKPARYPGRTVDWVS
jgi:hypothetical protein